MSSSHLFILLSLSLCCLCVLSVSPPVWPNTWSAEWKFVYSNNGSEIDGGDWYYDATTSRLRQDNYHHCDVIQPDTLCSAVFANNNMYYNMPTINFCCLCWTDLPITNPKWLVNTNYSDPPVASTVWTWNDGENHMYYQSVADLLPVAEGGGGTDIQWLGVSVGAVDPSVFDLVDEGCLTRQCPNNTFFCGNAGTSRAPRSAFEVQLYNLMMQEQN